MRVHRIRKIVSNSKGFCLGVSLPNYLADKWLDIHVSIVESGNSLLLISGAIPTHFTNNEIKLHAKVIDKIKL